MARDWIPVFVETPNKPEILAIARATNRTRDEVFGLLVRFWLWVQSVTVERHVCASPADICVTVGADENFWNAVIEAGWIIRTDTGFEIPNADDWLSKGAKARLLHKKRQDEYRRRQLEERRKRDANVTLKRHENGTTEENRILNPPISPLGDFSFEDLKSIWIAQEGSKLTPERVEVAIAEMATWPLADQVAALRHAIAQGRSRLVQLKTEEVVNHKPKNDPVTEREMRRARVVTYGRKHGWSEEQIEETVKRVEQSAQSSQVT